MIFAFPYLFLLLPLGWAVAAACAWCLVGAGFDVLWGAVCVVAGVVFSAGAVLWLSGRLHSRLLDILYQDLDPRRFLKRYQPLLDRPFLSAGVRLVMMSHLSNAWAALGEWDKALETLQLPKKYPEAQIESAKAILTANRAFVLIQKGDTDAAKKNLEALRVCLREDAEGKLREGLNGTQYMLEQQLLLMNGKKSDIEFWKKIQTNSNTLLDRANARMWLGWALVRGGQREKGYAQLQHAASDARELWTGKKAAELLRELSADEGPAREEAGQAAETE